MNIFFYDCWEGRDTLSQNSYKPFLGLSEASLNHIAAKGGEIISSRQTDFLDLY